MGDLHRRGILRAHARPQCRSPDAPVGVRGRPAQTSDQSDGDVVSVLLVLAIYVPVLLGWITGYSYFCEYRRAGRSQEYQDKWMLRWTNNAIRWGWSRDQLQAKLAEILEDFPGYIGWKQRARKNVIEFLTFYNLRQSLKRKP